MKTNDTEEDSSNIHWLQPEDGSLVDKSGNIAECSVSECGNKATVYLSGSTHYFFYCWDCYQKALESRKERL